jgi:hypothetical protein
MLLFGHGAAQQRVRQTPEAQASPAALVIVAAHGTPVGWVGVQTLFAQ